MEALLLVIIGAALIVAGRRFNDARTQHVLDEPIDEHIRRCNRMIHTTSGDQRRGWVSERDFISRNQFKSPITAQDLEIEYRFYEAG